MKVEGSSAYTYKTQDRPKTCDQRLKQRTHLNNCNVNQQFLTEINNREVL